MTDKEKTPVRFHPLFEPEDGVSSEDFQPEPFAAILVARLESAGRIRVPRRFAPDELPDLDAVFARFGGGTYELEARRADGTIYARRMRTLPGAPKGLVDSATVPDAPAASSSAPAAAGSSPPGDGSPLGMLAGRVDPMVLLLLHMSDQQSRNNAAMMQTIVAALSNRPVPPPPPPPPAGPDLGVLLTGIGSLVGAMKPAAPSPVSDVLHIQKLIREEATAQADAATRIADARAPETDTAAEVVKAVSAVAPLLQLLPVTKPPGVPPVPAAG